MNKAIADNKQDCLHESPPAYDLNNDAPADISLERQLSIQPLIKSIMKEPDKIENKKRSHKEY